MTIDGLELLAANLYKEAEEATPIVGGADKKDWMARKIEYIIENDDFTRLEELLNSNTVDDVIDKLDGWYEMRDADPVNLESEDELNVLEPDDEYIRSRYMADMNDDACGCSDVPEAESHNRVVSPVADVLGITDTMSDTIDQNAFREKKPVSDDITDATNDETSECYSTDAGKINTEKDKLYDDYVNERADQPEFVGEQPNRFEPDLVIEEEIVLVNNGVDDRMREAVDGKGENQTC